MMASDYETSLRPPKRPLRIGAGVRASSIGMRGAISESTPRETQRWQGGKALLFGLALCLLPVPATHIWCVYDGPSGDASGILYVFSLAGAGIFSISAAICFIAANLLWNGSRLLLHWLSR